MALTPLQRRDLRLLASLRGVSYLGDAIALVTLYLRVAAGGQHWLIAALTIAGALPVVTLSTLAGHVVDHVRARPLLAALGIAEALVCLALAQWHGDVITIALVALLNCGVAFSLPGYAALAPVVSGEENIAHGQSVLQSVTGVALAAGPALGGLLVGATGTSVPLILDAASFVVVGLGTLLLRSDRRPASSKEEESSPRDLGAGWRLVRTDPLVRLVVVLFGTILLCVGALNVVEVFFITQTLHASSLSYGLAGASFGGGSVAGALLSRRLRQDVEYLARTSFVCIAAISIVLGAIGLVDRVGWVFLLMGLTGVGAGVVNVAGTTLFALRTNDALRGRVYAAIGAIFTGAEISSMVLGGVLLNFLSIRTIYVAAGVASMVLVGTFGAVEMRRGQRVVRQELAQGE